MKISYQSMTIQGQKDSNAEIFWNFGKITLKCFSDLLRTERIMSRTAPVVVFKISQYLDTLIPYLIVNTRSKFFKTNTSQVILHKFTFHKNNFFIPEVQGTSKQAIVSLPKGLWPSWLYVLTPFPLFSK